MSRLFPGATRLGILILATLPASSFGAPLPGAPSAEVFGAIPRISHATISPDGNLLAWEDASGPAAQIVMFDVKSHKDRRLIPVPPRLKLRSLEWADGGTLLMTYSMTIGPERWATERNEVFRTLAVDATGGPSRILLATDQEGAQGYVTGASVLSANPGKARTIIMDSWDFSQFEHQEQTGTHLARGRADSGWLRSVFEVDTTTGKGKVLEHGTAFTQQWVLDRQGKPFGRSQWNPKEGRFSIDGKTASGWRELYTAKESGGWSVCCLSSDGKALIAVGPDGTSRSTVWTLPLDGSGMKPLLDDLPGNVEFVMRDPVTESPIAVALGGAIPKIRWIDPKAEARHKALEAAFPGRTVDALAQSEDGGRVVVLVQSPSDSPVYYLVDFAARTADTIGEEYPALANATLGKVRAITFRARDGLEIPAYLTLPPGASAKGLPLVAMPHGGPQSRDYYKFDWWAQFLATRGYAVLQPQFRGSTGFGEAFTRAGYREWGARMQDDVTDGVRAMIEEGIADPRRVCIVGASYGGYAALAGAAFTPDLYACAVSVAGVSDLPHMLAFEQNREGGESDAVYYWREQIGLPTDPKVADASPVHAAERVKAPVLLIHGIDDTVVPLSQSEEMAEGLQKLGRKVTFVRLPGEDHWLSGSPTRTRVLSEIETFLAIYLQPQAPNAVVGTSGAGQ